MKFRQATIFLIIVLAGVFLWLKFSRKHEPAIPTAPAKVSRPATQPAETVATSDASADPMPEASAAVAQNDNAASAPMPSPVLPTASPLPFATAAEHFTGLETGIGVSPLTVMENVRGAFRNYLKRFGGNPVGNNPEITAALNGGNPKQVVFLSTDDGLRTNDRGELIDNWETPFFFHQLSRTEMEIRSAGPDRRMWTADDLLIK